MAKDTLTVPPQLPVCLIWLWAVCLLEELERSCPLHHRAQSVSSAVVVWVSCKKSTSTLVWAATSEISTLFSLSLLPLMLSVPNVMSMSVEEEKDRAERRDSRSREIGNTVRCMLTNIIYFGAATLPAFFFLSALICFLNRNIFFSSSTSEYRRLLWMLTNLINVSGSLKCH